MSIYVLFEIVFLAIVQGIAEFLPISSSGHLAVISNLFNFDPESSVQVNIILHAGTLTSILVFYFKELISLLKFNAPDRKLIIAIIIGTIPAGIVGVALKKSGIADQLFNDPLVSGIGFLITATMLLFAMKTKKENNLTAQELSPGKALLIGLAQAVAILPGISRSGSTIAAGLKAGLKSADCAKFSFMLAIPAIGGAAFLELLSALKKQELAVNSPSMLFLAIGFAVSAAVGYIALTLLLKILNRGKLNVFAWYLYAVGTIVVTWRLIVIFT
ncbi:MAG: undecaprenyl-diphosphate phosphatase [Victivallaceae bacterium]